jgi:hypothetical protein
MIAIEPLYQIKLHADDESTWRDATRYAYDIHPEKSRRIVYILCNHTNEYPPLPEKSYLGDDVSYGYDSCDMRDYIDADRLIRIQEN